MFTIPNILSLMRIVIAFTFSVTYFSPHLRLLSFILLAVSGISDVLDGYIARKFNQVSELGKVLDPVSDKLTQFAVLICFCADGILNWWFVIIPAMRDIFMWVGGYIFYIKLGNKPIAAKWYGKLASFLFFLSIVITFAVQYMQCGKTEPGLTVITVAFLITVAASLFASVNYILSAVKANNERIALGKTTK